MLIYKEIQFNYVFEIKQTYSKSYYMFSEIFKHIYWQNFGNYKARKSNFH